jgi:PAS domain S-box-containing protein
VTGAVVTFVDITKRLQAEESLRESEANFRTFFETMTDMIMVGTPEGQILFTNAAVTRTLGYLPDELKTMHLLDVHPADKRQEAEVIFAAMFRGERESCPLPLASKDGTLVPVETRVWFGRWNGENCLFGICKNLSAEQEAQQRFERLFRNNPSLIALSTVPGRQYVDVNDAFLATLGYSRDEVVGHTSTEFGLFAHPEQQAAVADQLQADGRIADVELQVRCKDGALLDGLFSGEVINNQGRHYLLTVMTDITARKRAERDLARLSEIQRDLMRLATDFVNVPLERQDAAIDQSLATMGQLIHADRAYLFAYDFGAGVMNNTHEWCNDGITPEIGNLQEVPNAMIPDWVAAHRCGECVHVPSVAALPTDSFLWQVLAPQGIRSLITLPLMQGADCLGFVGFDAVKEERSWQADDVSLLRVLAELYAHFEARRATERETRALQSRLTQARDAAQAAAIAKSMFLANMSHEIRTPLNAILGYAQIMQRECRTCPTGQRLKVITRSGEHLLELLTDLLELVRSDAHTITLAPSAFDFHQALEDVRLMFIRHPAAQALTLAFTCSPDVPHYIYADSGKIRQVLVNLVGNAVKFTEKGSVRLSASVVSKSEQDGLTLAVDVEDTGYGIGKDDLERIFEAFEQAELGRRGGKGTGLGLSLSRRYARALGGELTVTSRLGEGSLFRFIFLAKAASGEAPGQRAQGSVLRLAPGQRAVRLLVVDDDAASREMLAAMLEPVGFAVETAASAEQALRRLSQSGGIDLVLMDKRMPEMNGYEAIRRIRELPGGRELPVVVVTASGFANEGVPALAAGANGYVSKPVRREQLLEEIGKAGSIRYGYELEQGFDSDAAAPAELDAGALARLPEEKLRILDQALRRGDILLLRKTVEEIAQDHAGPAAGMRALLDAYDYARMRLLLDSVKGING